MARECRDFRATLASLTGSSPNLKLQRRGNHGESEIDGAVRERDLITDRIPIDFVNQSASRSPGHIISDMGMSDPAPSRLRQFPILHDSLVVEVSG